MPIIPHDADPATYPPQTCTKCGVPKPISEFDRQSPTKTVAACKECRKARITAAYQRNKVEIQAKRKATRGTQPSTTPEAVRAYSAEYRKTAAYKAWREAYKPIGAERSRKFREAHPEKEAESQAKYYAANREAKAERRRKWAQANPERWKAYCAIIYNRRRNRDAAVVNDLTAEEWAEIQAEQGHRCFYCRVPFGLVVSPTRDHIVPVSKGGGLTRSNIVAACQSCNSSKGTNAQPRPPKAVRSSGRC